MMMLVVRFWTRAERAANPTGAGTVGSKTSLQLSPRRVDIPNAVVCANAVSHVFNGLELWGGSNREAPVVPRRGRFQRVLETFWMRFGCEGFTHMLTHTHKLCRSFSEVHLVAARRV